MKYIIKITDRGLVNFVGAGSYRVNKERFAVLTERQDEAKKYKSYLIAKRAYETLSQTCENLGGTVEYVKVDETSRDRQQF